MAPCDAAELDEDVQSLWDDYSVVATRLADLEPAKRLTWLQEARLGSAVAYVLAATERRQGKAAGVIGDATLRLGRSRDSARAFAKAYDLGYQESWVADNWAFAAKTAVTEGASPQHLVKNGIKAAPRLSDDDVGKELKKALRVRAAEKP
jgi:hypothetical protein